MNLSRTTVIMLSLMLATGAWAATENQNQAIQLLGSMAKAHRQLNYHGTFVYINGSQLDTMSVAHAADQRGERERLIHLNGSAREIIRHNDISTCILPEEASVIVEKHSSRPSSPFFSGEDVAAFEGSYYITLAGQERIAGQKATLLSIQPRDQYRYGYQLWVDAANGMLLKSALLDEQGAVIEQFMFTDIKYVDTVPDSLLQSKIDAHKFKWYRQGEGEQQPVAGHQRWRVRKLPEGFQLASYERQQSRHLGDLVDHMLYTDGLASVSVFIEKLKPKMEQREGPTNMGVVNATAVVTEGHQVIVIGDVPVITTELMANSVSSPWEADHD
ncbi:MAG: hypothetical protein A2V90_03630 [Gammaproteobacteria bacterium RBG_16_57_12]|nr:MAG: hypothetical protein A2V90_03630 [Gammaproteobacteria bacterium RBG_16_57_12]